MKEQNKRIQLLGSVPVPRALLAMGIPSMLGMMLSALYNLADACFVGRLGASALGAVSVSYPLGQIIVGIGLLFGNGAASYIARLLGKGERERAGKAASTAVYGSVFAGGAVIVCILLFLKPTLKLLGATDGILPYAMAYAGIYTASSVFGAFNVTMNSIVTSEGAAKVSMCAMVTGAVLNIALDPIFIYSLGLGVTGAAIATAVSQAVSSLLYLIYIFEGRSIFRFRIRECRFRRDMLSEIMKIGVPALLFQLLSSLAVALTNTKAAAYGDSAIAGMGAVTRVLSLATMMVFGFLKGFQPIAGYSYGAKNEKRLREAVRTAVRWTTLFCVLLGAILILFPGEVISLFTKGDGEMIEIGKEALRMNGFSVMLFGFHAVYSSLFLALGRAKEGLFLGVCRQGICFIPLVLLLPAALGLNGILYAQPAADVLTAGITAVMAVRLAAGNRRSAR